ncbi:MAG: hypothetical protein Kow0037_12160 [Calditrichia bacterium]
MGQLTKSQKRLLVVLAVVLAYAVFDITTNWDSYTGVYKGKRNKGKSKSSKIITPKKIIKDSSFVYNKDWGKDPFYVKVKTSKKNKTLPKKRVPLKLIAVSSDGNTSVAMINDKILQVGESIAGYTVAKIEPTRVILKKGKDTRILLLK